MKKLIVTLLLLFIYTQPVFAAKYDLEFASNLSNNAFEDIAHETGTLIAFRSLAPASGSDVFGLDIGVEVSVMDIESDSWDLILDSGDAPSSLAAPKLHGRVELPFNINVGAIYSKIPESNIALFGGELQWAAIDGSAVMPAVALRGSFSNLSGVDDFDLSTYGLDAVVSKGFGMGIKLTPYAGIGMISIAGEYTGDDVILKPLLKDQDFTDMRTFVGAELQLGFIRFTVDGEFGEYTVYTGKVSAGF